jgi:3-dehydroquinate synthase
MQIFRVELGPASHEVHVGGALLDDLGALALGAGLKPTRSIVVTDSNVAPLYGDRVTKSLERAGFKATTATIAAGEESKSEATLGSLYDRMTAAELDRSGTVFALGGGVVGDLAGFAAATFLRGISVVQIPTTMVAQVDSSLGGKTGINHRLAKNLIGAFHQPRLIVADVDTLATLPEREFREGLGEVIKYGAIMDAPMISTLEQELEAILARSQGALEEIVARSLRHKASVVSADEREGGLRKILNFGHTIGHAIEAGAGYGGYLHGEAVAIGMAAASKLSNRYGGLSNEESSRLTRLIARMGLPVEMPLDWRGDRFFSALRLDKKRSDDVIEFVLLDRLGHAFTRKLSFDEIVASLN